MYFNYYDSLVLETKISQIMNHLRLTLVIILTLIFSECLSQTETYSYKPHKKKSWIPKYSFLTPVHEDEVMLQNHVVNATFLLDNKMNLKWKTSIENHDLIAPIKKDTLFRIHKTLLNQNIHIIGSNRVPNPNRIDDYMDILTAYKLDISTGEITPKIIMDTANTS